MMSPLSLANAPSPPPLHVYNPNPSFLNNALLRQPTSAPVFASSLTEGFPDVARIPESKHMVFTTAPNGNQRAYYATSDASDELLSRKSALNRRIFDDQLTGVILGSLGVFGGIALSTATYFLQWPSVMYALSIGLPPAIFGYFYADSLIASSKLDNVNRMVDKYVDYIDFEPKPKSE